MSHRCLAAVFTVIALVALAPVFAVAQPTDTSSPRTPWGAPDLQGVWDFRTITPLERPEELAAQELLTEEQAAEREARALERTVDRPPAPGNTGSYNRFWVDTPQLVHDGRTSLITDPPEGNVPWTQEGEERQAARTEVRQRLAHGPEDRSVGERCILGFNAGPPITPGGYNQNMQIFQTRDQVVILNEMVNDARIIPLDGRSHLPEHMRQWRGDSRGRWEADTLVVETMNFYFETSLRGSSPNMHLVERLTRVDADTLLYEYTVQDRRTWTQPWTAEISMRKTEDLLFEYACHEGNYGLYNILVGARAEEQQ